MTRLFVSFGGALPGPDLAQARGALAECGEGELVVFEDEAVALAVGAPGSAAGAIWHSADLVVGVAGDVLWADSALAAEWPVRAMPDRGARLLAEAWRRHGERFLAHVDGNFAVVLLDRRARQLVLGTDRFGGVPVSWTRSDGRVMASSHLAALAGEQPPDAAAVFDLLAFGYLVGEKTLLQDVRRLPPGATVSFQDGRARVTPYWVPQWQPDPACHDPRELGVELAAVLRGVVTRQTRGVERPGALLSGGHDSRVLVAACDALEVPLATWTFGDPDSQDAVLARQVARALQLPHEVVGLGAADVVDHAPRALRLTDGAFNLFHAHGISVLPRIAAGCSALLNGITALHGAHTSRLVRRVGSGSHAEPHPRFLIGDLMAVRLPDGGILGTVFGGSEALLRPEVRSEFAATTAASAAAFAGMPPTSECVWDRAERAYLHGRLARFTGNGPILGRAFLPVRTPLLDQEFLAFCRRLPPVLRGADKAIVAHAIRTLSPRAARVALSGTGRAAGLPAWLDLLCRARGRARRTLERLGLTAAKPARPYADYERWLREPGPLRALVDEVLLGGASALDPWIAPEGVQQLVRAQRGGWPGSECIGRLLTLELAMRWLRAPRAAGVLNAGT